MSLAFREAAEPDIKAVVALLADDILGQTREGDGLQPYLAAFRQMSGDPNNSLIVGTSDGRVVACYQLTIIPGISLSGATRAQIEGVRVAGAARGTGLGAALIADAEARARTAGATLLQLTMNGNRADAHRFYTANGFTPSHVGFKKQL